MEGYYFGKHEQIDEGGMGLKEEGWEKAGRRKAGRGEAEQGETQRGETLMIIMDIKADNLYALKKFHMNMSYPKKIVDSTIPGEYLAEKPNFRYKKVNIIMGGNATGKTSLGKLLMIFANYFKDGNYKYFINVVNDKTREAVLSIDFVTNREFFYRFALCIDANKNGDYQESDIHIHIYYTNIGKKDNYETCAKRIDGMNCQETTYDKINTSGWYFSYPQDAWKNKTYSSIQDDDNYLYILEQTLKTLDPSIKEVIKVSEVDNTYAIKLNNHSVIIQDGKIADTEILSSGTKAGLDISYIIASLVCDKHDLYYCDELFSYVNSDVEKACLSIIIEKLTEKKQLFFTTHNVDILDMQLPKHSFTFLKKDLSDEELCIKCINAAEFLKRNTDSLKNAVENDLFCTTPELHRLYDIAEL